MKLISISTMASSAAKTLPAAALVLLVGVAFTPSSAQAEIFGVPNLYGVAGAGIGIDSVRVEETIGTVQTTVDALDVQVGLHGGIEYKQPLNLGLLANAFVGAEAISSFSWAKTLDYTPQWAAGGGGYAGLSIGVPYGDWGTKQLGIYALGGYQVSAWGRTTSGSPKDDSINKGADNRAQDNRENPNSIELATWYVGGGVRHEVGENVFAEARVVVSSPTQDFKYEDLNLDFTTIRFSAGLSLLF